MMITHGIRTVLLAQSSITTLAPSQTVGLNTIPAIFTDNAPRGIKPPFVLVELEATDPMLTLDSTYDNSLIENDINIVACAYTPEDARALSNTIKSAFEDYSGTAGSSDTIKAVNWMDETYESFYPDEGRDTKYHQITTSFKVFSKPN